jgi:hypothetical protein
MTNGSQGLLTSEEERQAGKDRVNEEQNTDEGGKRSGLSPYSILTKGWGIISIIIIKPDYVITKILV